MLVLVRHGSASEGNVDRDRALSSVGRSEVNALREALEERKVRVDRILHSGLRRAEETAEILASLSDSPPREHSGLKPAEAPDLFVAELADLGGATLIVSHLPFLPSLCEELLESVSVLPEFRTATAVCLEEVDGTREPGGWQLAWWLDGRSRLLQESEPGG